ncbi:MAG: hypothetical protein E8D51_09915 [Nitrospira sp.]|jgi:hypothetical protein|nr:hypothetical protein [Nitrospirota bacterium]TKB32585.1 MAG: hypothetical protein E8D51_09915 [Nitrospira sp.]
MKQLLSGILVACLAVVIVTGCRGAGQIYNVKEAPIASSTGKELTLDQVGKAIVDAGIGLRWIMVITKPGQIVATQNARSHTAIVDIAYDTKTYSMTYKDSVNLNYNAEKQTIHEAYSGWIRNLDNAIKGRLAAAGM